MLARSQRGRERTERRFDRGGSLSPIAIHVSVSTTRTLVGTAPRGFHQGSEAHTKEAGEVAVNEAKEEHKDAMCPIYDQLALKWWWWILEVLPFEQRRQMPDNQWKRYMT